MCLCVRAVLLAAAILSKTAAPRLYAPIIQMLCIQNQTVFFMNYCTFRNNAAPFPGNLPMLSLTSLIQKGNN